MPARSYLPQPDRWKAIAIPAGFAVLVIGTLACLLLAMAVREADDLVIKRDRTLAASLLRHAMEKIAHDQESVTAWDEAVSHLHGPFDPDWLDDNIGTWMNMYYGHERVAVVDPQDRPIYASIGSQRVAPAAFEDLAPVALPMISELRGVLVRRDWHSSDPAVRSPGVKDISIVDGHPALISVKPVVPSTTRLRQSPAETYVHVTISNLDGNFLNELGQLYLFQDARFAWQDRPDATEQSFALRDRRAKTIGYLIWRPRLPGQVLAKRMLPALAVILGAILIVVAILVACLRRGADALLASEKRARHLAFHDTLTGLPNRACFNERLSTLYKAEQRGGALFLLDLDRFKQVNDTLGHPAGDALLRHVGAELLAHAPIGATVVRLGGDEFAILVPIMQRPAAADLGAAIVARLCAPARVQDAWIDVGVSIGVAFRDDADSVEALIRIADKALYAAKRAGGGLILADDPNGIVPHTAALAA